jgi:hypothetical protein
MFEYRIIKQQNTHGFYCNKCGKIHSPAASRFSYATYASDTYINGTQSCSKSFARDKIDYLNICGVKVNQLVMS